MSISTFEDIGFHVTWESSDYWVSFKVYEYIGTVLGSGEPVLQDASGRNVFRFEDAAVYLTGDIKWDGCSNWYFEEQDRCMLHFCGLKDTRKLAELFRRMYEIALEEMPKALMESFA